MRNVSSSVAVATLLLSGCTMVPKYERPAAPVPASYPGAQASGEGNAADLRWQTFFVDERLKALVARALANNRDLRAAALRVEQSRAQYRITRSASYPALDASGSASRQHASGVTTTQWSASAGISAYELDFFGRVRSLNAQALEQYLATEEARRSAQISLVAEVASQYLSLQLAEEELALARNTLSAVEASYNLNKATFDAGASNELDLRTAEGQVQIAKINVITFERQVAQARNALELLLGEPLPADLPPARSLDDKNLLADIPAGLPSELISRRPDILQAEHTLKAANANIGAARAAFFPSLRLTTTVGTASREFSGLFGSGSGTWAFSPQLTVPIFTGGQNRANLDYAKLSKQIEIANYEKAIQTAFREVSDALVATSNWALLVQARANLIDIQQRRYDLANARYRQGEDNYLNVLSAQQDLYNAQQGRIEAQYNRLSSQVDLYRALGGGWN